MAGPGEYGTGKIESGVKISLQGEWLRNFSTGVRNIYSKLFPVWLWCFTATSNTLLRHSLNLCLHPGDFGKICQHHKVLNYSSPNQYNAIIYIISNSKQQQIQSRKTTWAPILKQAFAGPPLMALWPPFTELTEHLSQLPTGLSLSPVSPVL